MTGYVTSVLAVVRAKLRAREASSFIDFRQMTCSPFWRMQTFVFLDVLLKDNYT